MEIKWYSLVDYFESAFLSRDFSSRTYSNVRGMKCPAEHYISDGYNLVSAYD